jgi:hypothetical protein
MQYDKESSESVKSTIHDSSHLHDLLPDMSGRPGAILVDKTIALILGAIGSAAIAAAFAVGIALIGKSRRPESNWKKAVPSGLSNTEILQKTSASLKRRLVN